MPTTTCGSSTGPTPSTTTSRPPTSWPTTRARPTRSRCRARRPQLPPSADRRLLQGRAAGARLRPAGDLVKSWGGPGEGYDWPDSNHGITVDHKGNVWLAGNGDKDTQILKFTSEGRFLLQIGKHGVHNGSNDVANFWQPTKIFDDAGADEIYVADGYGNRRVIVFDGEDRRLQAALGRLRRQAERREGAALQSEGAAVEALQHGALRRRRR